MSEINRMRVAELGLKTALFLAGQDPSGPTEECYVALVELAEDIRTNLGFPVHTYVSTIKQDLGPTEPDYRQPPATLGHLDAGIPSDQDITSGPVDVLSGSFEDER